MEQIQSQISCITWNICWGCMSANDQSQYDVTAKKLALRCKEISEAGQQETCLYSVGNFLNTANHDIIALQEVVNYEEILNRLNNERPETDKYRYINCSIKNAYGNDINITTFYKFNKLRPYRVYSSNIFSKNDVRPYQIILFRLIRTKKLFYFINLHNGHLISVSNLEKKLNTPIRYINLTNIEWSLDLLIDDENNYFEKVEQRVLPSLNSNNGIINEQGLPVIAAGDYNDHGKYDYWNQLNLLNKQLGATAPPLSCCTPSKTHIIWLGAPSVIYNPNVRRQILEIPLDFLFDITTFSSTACIVANSIAGQNKDFDLYETYDRLYARCNSDMYRSHNSYSPTLKEFIRNDISKVKVKLLEDQQAVEKDHPNNPYLRYNEILAYFFPWEIFGLEVGKQSFSDVIFLKKVIEKRRKSYAGYYVKLLTNAARLNSILQKINNTNKISDPTDDEIKTGNMYSLVKYFKVFISYNRRTQGPDFEITSEYLVEKINLIIQHLNKPIVLCEYYLDSFSNKFELALCPNDKRETKFDIFTQTGGDAASNFVTEINPVPDFIFEEQGVSSGAKQEGFPDRVSSGPDAKSSPPLPPRTLTSRANRLVSVPEFNPTAENPFPLVCRCLLIDTSNLPDTDQVKRQLRRRLSTTQHGAVLLENAILENFKGRLTINNRQINLVANPSTVIMKGVNVVITSQILDRDYGKNPISGRPTEYNAYLDSLEIGLRTNSYNNDIKYGDYILISQDLSFATQNRVPDAFNKGILTSDHLPIEAVINFPAVALGGKKNKKKTKRKSNKNRKIKRKETKRKK